MHGATTPGATSSAETRWWGTFSVSEGQSGRWRVGSTTLWIERLSGQWRLAFARAGGEGDHEMAVEVRVPCPGADLDELAGVARFAVAGDDDRVLLSPRLADRPVVIRPASRFVVVPRHQVTLFVSTPAWVQVSTADGEVLVDEPWVRPSDTWFGPTTTEGELVYASRTTGRLRISEVPFRPHRVVTAVTVENDGDSPLPIERMLLPVAHLSIFRREGGQLWTENVQLRRTGEQGFARFHVRTGEPVLEPGVEPLAEPREVPGEHAVVRAFSAITDLFR